MSLGIGADGFLYRVAILLSADEITEYQMLSGQAAHTKDFSFHIREALFETRADAIVATDRDGVIRIWNAGAIRIFGFGVEEAIGRPLDIIIPENLLPLKTCCHCIGRATGMSWKRVGLATARLRSCQFQP